MNLIYKIKKFIFSLFHTSKKKRDEFNSKFNSLIDESNKDCISNENDQCEILLAKLDDSISEVENYLSAEDEYLDKSFASRWSDKYYDILSLVREENLRILKNADSIKKLRNKAVYANNLNITLEQKIEKHNEDIDNKRIIEAYNLIGKIEGYDLDRQQMRAIVRGAHNNLIVAGAGTGKTTTIIGKIKYLLAKSVRPEDILVLSFTNASASEMSNRINKETGLKISASTFHKLGLNILTSVEGKKPLITNINLREFVKNKLDELMNDKSYAISLGTYLFYNRVVAKSEFDFSNEKEYQDYLVLNPPVTMRNEAVKSYGEMDIANFLYVNGIEYIYEPNYIIDTRNSEFSQYHPDFLLPEYGIYIEYFGIDSNGEVPAWFVGENGLSAKEIYNRSIEWKRELHKTNGTKLVECFSYEKYNGSLLDHLEKTLKDIGVNFKPKTYDELWAIVCPEDNNILSGVVELFETVINLLKSRNLSIVDFKNQASQASNASRYLHFISLLEPIYKSYVDLLHENNEIDFNDMINKATEYVNAGKYHNSFSYVIVDEYQDISNSRHSLLSALRKSKDYNLFCVGDDWQSIYRFAGSDINYILNFEKYWGPTFISKIETTYRFTPWLIDISSSFITKNPQQIKKNLRSVSIDNRFSLGEINAYNEKYLVEFMSERLKDFPLNSSVFLIGRYSFDIDLIKDSKLFDYRYNNVSGFVDVKFALRKDLIICFMTAHRSKGLQADYVIIINNKNTRMGFPSKVQDDPILNLLIDNFEIYPFAEERRLYYVAITRARVKAFFLTLKNKESVFAVELHNKYSNYLKHEQFECPKCGGTLIRKKGPYGEFLGCSNYKITGCKYTRKIIKKENIKNENSEQI